MLSLVLEISMRRARYTQIKKATGSYCQKEKRLSVAWGGGASQRIAAGDSCHKPFHLYWLLADDNSEAMAQMPRLRAHNNMGRHWVFGWLGRGAAAVVRQARSPGLPTVSCEHV